MRLLDEARAHEAQTHATLGAILGTDDSLEQCALRMRAERDALKKDAKYTEIMRDAIVAQISAQRDAARAEAEANRRDAARGAYLLAQHVHYYGSIHEDDCPEEDTCSCPLAAGVNELIRRYPQTPIDLDAAMQEPGRE